MKQFLTTLSLVLAMASVALAQRTVLGTVTGDDGEALVGASVSVKGAAAGARTDLNGKYQVEVPAGSSVLVYTYTGYTTQEITLGASNVVNVVLVSGVQLEEAVVTALGLTRNKSDVVYANQTVNSEDLNSVTNKSVLNALQGKVAGVKIGSASGAVGASTRIVLRGETSLTQGNNALIVVDGVPINNNSASGGGGTGKAGDRDNYVDFGNRGNDINPDDVESVTVLKGPAATTLYGSRGGSGVILVTTKKGKKGDKANISISSSYSAEEAYLLYQPQQQFGSGYKTCNGCGGGIDIFMGENFAWGAPLDGRLIPWTGQPADADGNLIPLNNGKTEQLVRPYSAVKNNLQDFFDIGNTVRNSIAVSGGTDKFNYYVSYTNFNNEGIVHNTKLNKNNLLLNVGSQFSSKLRSDFSLNYSKLNQRGATEGGYPFGYSSGTPALAFLTQTPPNIPINELRDYNSPYQDFKGFYGQYSINPFYILDKQDVRNTVDNIISNVSLTFTPIQYLSIVGRISTNFFTSNVTEKGPKFFYERTLSWSDGDLSDFESPRNSFSLGSYKESTARNIDMVYDAFASYARPLSDDFKMTATLGYNSLDRSVRNVAGTTVGGLVIPEFYDLTNSAESPRSAATSSRYRLMGVYANASLGFRNWLFGEYSAREDLSSTLPKGKRGFFYQGGGISIVPSALESFHAGPLTFLKFRAGLGSAGKDAPLYRLDSYYGLNPLLLDLGDDYQIRFPFNTGTVNVPGAQKLNVIGNPELKPELSITSEVGVDLEFFNGRIGVEYTYYNINSKNQIVDVNIPWSSGYSIVPLNIGRMVNKGHELALRFTPVSTKLINWKLYGSYSHNSNVVKEIIKNDVQTDELAVFSGLVHFTGHGSLNLIAAEGKPFGTFKGTNYVYDDQGRVVVDSRGNPKQSANLEYLGDYQPKFLASLGTELTVLKRISVRALLDGRKGGLFYSGTKVSTEFNGTASSTLIHDRLPYVVENSVGEGGAANTTETTAYSYFKAAPASSFLLDASYLKLREVAISYNIPVSATHFFTGITIGVFGKNLKYWVAKENTFADPEVGGVGGASDAVGIETTTTPTSKSYGVELKLNF